MQDSPAEPAQHVNAHGAAKLSCIELVNIGTRFPFRVARTTAKRTATDAVRWSQLCKRGNEGQAGEW